MTNQDIAARAAAGVSAVLSGLLCIASQPMYPQENVATVADTAWVVVHK